MGPVEEHIQQLLDLHSLLLSALFLFCVTFTLLLFFTVTLSSGISWCSGFCFSLFSCFLLSIQLPLLLSPISTPAPLPQPIQKAYLLNLDTAILRELFPALKGWCMYTSCRNADAAFWELMMQIISTQRFKYWGNSDGGCSLRKVDGSAKHLQVPELKMTVQHFATTQRLWFFFFTTHKKGFFCLFSFLNQMNHFHWIIKTEKVKGLILSYLGYLPYRGSLARLK